MLLAQKLSLQQLALVQKLGLESRIENILIQINQEKMTQQQGFAEIRELLQNKKVDLNRSKLSFEDLKEYFDEGDYIQASGKLDYSQRGEPSLFVEQFEILTKALRPLPEKMEYENFEERYLHRVVDFKMNTKDKNGLTVREMLKLKSKYWLIWREEMLKEGFIEVETPVFKLNPSGAESKPFVTFYNELDQEVYMRMELELAQKKLIAGGFEKVFEIGRQFRNEGSSPQHLQEYTQIEWYGAYLDYNYGMKLTKKIYQKLAAEIIGGLIQKDYYGNTINWGEWCGEKEAKQNGWQLLEGWPQIPYYSAMRHFSDGKVDVENKSVSELVKIAKSLDIEAEENLGVATIMDKIWKKVRVNVTNPIFLILPPVELEPLAKRHPQNPNLTERFQVVAGGNELGKGFSELNDPLDQLERFAEQQQARDAGNEEAMAMDMDYVEALEYGTPPMAGFGTSERFFAFLLGKHIRECVTFPHVRTQNKDNLATKSKTTMVAHCLILDTPEIPNWSKLNAAAHLSASFAARIGKKLIHIEETITTDGQKIPMNIQHAIIMKKTAERTDLLQLKRIAEKNELTVSVFTEEMRDSSDDLKVKAKQEAKNSQEIGYLGILVFGQKKEVEKLTKEFEMMG